MKQLKMYLFNYFKKYKVFPDIDTLSKQLKITKEELIKILDKLKAQGFLGKHNDAYYIKNTSEVEQDINITSNKKLQTLSEKIIRHVMAAISLIAIFISINYTADWLLNFLDDIRAWVWSFAMVAYAVFSPQATLLMWAQGRRALSIIIGFTSVIMICFSIISTIAGQYKTNDTKIESNLQQTQLAQLNLLKDKEQRLKDSIIEINNEMKTHQSLLETLSKDENRKKEFNNTKWKIEELRSKRIKYEKEIDDLSKEMQQYYAKDKVVVEEHKDFYVWVNSVLPWLSPSQIEFWMYLFPAIFVDIMAPLGLMVYLGKHNKRKKEKDE